MKKFIALILAIMAILSCTSAALAADKAEGLVRARAGAQASPNEWDIPLSGIDRWDAKAKTWVAVPEADLESTWATIHSLVTRSVTVGKKAGTSANVEEYSSKRHMPEYRLRLAETAAQAAITVRLPGNSRGISPLAPTKGKANRVVGEDPTDWSSVFAADGTLVVFVRQASGKDAKDAVHDGYVHIFCYQGSGSGSKKPSQPSKPSQPTQGTGTGHSQPSKPSQPTSINPPQEHDHAGEKPGTGSGTGHSQPTQGSGTGHSQPSSGSGDTRPAQENDHAGDKPGTGSGTGHSH